MSSEKADWTIPITIIKNIHGTIKPEWVEKNWNPKIMDFLTFIIEPTVINHRLKKMKPIKENIKEEKEEIIPIFHEKKEAEKMFIFQ